MRNLLLSLVALGTVAAATGTRPAMAQPDPLHWSPGVETVQYYEPGWRERDEWRRREEWRRHEEWRRRQEWRQANEWRGYPPPRPPPPPYGSYGYPRY